MTALFIFIGFLFLVAGGLTAILAVIALMCLHADLDGLENLLMHMFIHSGYKDCGFMQMTTRQKRRFVDLLEDNDHTETAARLREHIRE